MSMKPNTMRDFYEWVKARDPEETYIYNRMDDCARARYCRDRGLSYRGNDCLDKHPIELASYQPHQTIHVYGRLTMAGLRKEIEEHWL